MLGLLLESVSSAQPSEPQRKPRVARERRKGLEQTREYKWAQALYGILPKCREAIQSIHASRRGWPGDRKRCESEARKVGFSNQAEIDVLTESKTAEAAAAKIIAHRKELSSKRAQNAWSAHKKLFQQSPA
jgi:hypothetical protein